MSLDGILSSGLSSVQTNSSAMRVTADNIANVHTPGYVRRVVQQQTLAPGGVLAGVELANVQRVINEYLDKEVLSASGNASRFDVQSTIMDQLNAALGSPGDGNSLGARMDAIYAALGQASLDPSSLTSRLGALNELDTFARTISNLSDSIASLRAGADQQISTVVTQANTLIQQIVQLNPQIQHAITVGDTGTGLLDQRDLLVQQLSQLMGIRTAPQPDGRLFVSTLDGIQLVGDNYSVLSCSPTNGPSFNSVTIQTRNALSGQLVGGTRTFDSHSATGELRGLLDIRDGVLASIGTELGSYAQAVAQAFNAAHNASAAVPPPSSLEGRQTGLLDTDTLNFTGATTLGIADAGGKLLHKIDIDFDNGTLSLDNGPATSFVPMFGTASIGNFVATLNSVLGGNGTASFTDGMLSLSASGGNGLVISDDASNPTSRAGVAFSQFFGLNDLFVSAGNMIPTTGLQSSDIGGFVPGGTISLLLKGPAGQRVGETTVSVTGTTIGDMVAALNSAFTGKASFTLDANGQMQVTPAANYSDYDLEVTLDTTSRGTTGESFSSLFGMGTSEEMARAQSFRLASGVEASPQALAFAQPSLSSSSLLGDTVVTPGDNRGLLALQDLINQVHSFSRAGALPARSVSFGDYAAALYQDVASRGNAIDTSKSAEDTRLNLAKQKQSEKEGVNLDEELENMMVLQQAYNAGARLLQVAKELYDELLKVV